MEFYLCNVKCVNNYFQFFSDSGSDAASLHKERRRSLCAKWIKGLETILLISGTSGMNPISRTDILYLVDLRVLLVFCYL